MQIKKKKIKKGVEICEYVELVKLADKGNVRRFYENMRRLTEGFNTVANICRAQRGDLAADAQSILQPHE